MPPKYQKILPIIIILFGCILYYLILYPLSIVFINMFFELGLLPGSILSIILMITISLILLKISGVKYRRSFFIWDIISGLLLYAILTFFSYSMLPAFIKMGQSISHALKISWRPVLFIIISTLFLLIRYYRVILNISKREIEHQS